jgi:hypothetical protein
MSEEQAADLARSIGGVDLVLLNESRPELKPKKIAESTWIVGRPEAGSLATARLQLGEGKEIRSVGVEKIDLVPAQRTKGNLWTWLGLASRPTGRRILARPVPKPIVGIDLRDPRKYLEELGFPDATLESTRCAVPQALLERVANRKVVAFGLTDRGRKIGNLYRVHVQLPNQNGDFIVNLLLDREGRIVRASTKIDPFLVLRQTILAPILAEWEGKTPAEVEITEERYPGVDTQLRHLLDAFGLAAEINRNCP